MAKLEESGYRGWWPIKVHVGKGQDGKLAGPEGFRNMFNGQVVVPEKGWNGEPPYATGDSGCVKTASDQYRENYDRIFGSPPWERSHGEKLDSGGGQEARATA